MILSATYTISDCIDVISGATDQSSKFGSNVSLRNSGTGSITYDSTNQRYSINITREGESYIPITSCNGLDDFVIEFDGYFDYLFYLGLTIYSDGNNWARFGIKTDWAEYGIKSNGSYSEANITNVTTTTGTWTHHKYTITNNTIRLEVYNGSTLLYDSTRTYDSSWFTSNTKYGFVQLWATSWHQYFKNLQIKPL